MICRALERVVAYAKDRLAPKVPDGDVVEEQAVSEWMEWARPELRKKLSVRWKWRNDNRWHPLSRDEDYWRPPPYATR